MPKAAKVTSWGAVQSLGRRRTDPEAPLPILVEREDDGPGQALRLAVCRGDAPPRSWTMPAALAWPPRGWACRSSHDCGYRVRACCSRGPGRSTIRGLSIARQAVAGPDPEPSVLAHEQRPHLVARQAVGHGERLESRRVNRRRPFPIRAERHERLRSGPWPGRRALGSAPSGSAQAIALTTREPPIGPDPEDDPSGRRRAR